MSERKVLNKYYPPDFDPSKIKRRKGINKDKQMVIRLMAPFSMRCNRCGEYIYKGKKFNARKETAEGEEYYGIKIFRFYIKCTMCSSEITFKTDPKNADYTMEHGATRNFENWSESDPTGSKRLLPDAAADDEYDSEGNPIEDKKERDAMADLERSQEQSRREMELMDELADLRQRNARVELNNVDADTLLEQLHAERENAEEEARKAVEQAEDDALVAQYFSKIPSLPTGEVNGKAKGKEKVKADRPAIAPPGLVAGRDDDEVNGGALPAVLEEGANSGNDSDDASDSGSDAALPAALTIKRRPPPAAAGASNGHAEPSVATLLAARGMALENGTANGGGSSGSAQAQTAAAAKRKREGMQKLLGIKKKK